MNIKEFVKIEKYDFSDDCDYSRNQTYKQLSGYEKYFVYKTASNIKDPDLDSVLLQDIYKTLWPDLEEKEFMTDKKWIKSDTMTSVQYTLAKYYEKNFPNEIMEYKEKNKRQKWISVNMCKTMYEQYESVRRNLEENNELKRFVSIYHSLGNYSPVPVGFNAARSGIGYSSNYDYWDLTLMKIKQYFDFRKQQSIEVPKAVLPIAELFHVDKVIKNCAMWLDSYENWSDFVEKNYFQDYVDEKGEIIPFCEGHSWSNGCNDIIDFGMFCKNVCDRIDARSKRMIDALNKKVECKL